jgi:hypothetical protein
MPYTHCPSCRLQTFSAAAYASRDECPRCGSELALQPRRLFGSRGQDVVLDAQVEDAAAEVA